MKTFFCYISFILLFFYNLIFIGCSKEVTITMPDNSESNSLLKSVSTSVVSVNHLTDTILVLPKCGKTVRLSKQYTSAQIAQIDNYLSTHTLTVKTSTVTPNALACQYHDTYDYEYEDFYETVPSKNLGIWCNYLPYYKCLQYGFNKYFVSGNPFQTTTYNNAIQQAIDSGYTADNIMASLWGDYSVDYPYLNASPKNIGAYFVDEPLENDDYSISEYAGLSTALQNNLPNSKIYYSSYIAPDICLTSPRTWGGASKYADSVVLSHSNFFIMCDQYNGDCCGQTVSYWQDFHDNFPSQNISNWIHVVINNGTNGGHVNCTGSTLANGWEQLFDKANSLGLSTLWLYAVDTGNEAAIKNFVFYGWVHGWMYRSQVMLETEWMCHKTNPCTNCNWQNQGDWTIIGANIIVNRSWVPY